MNENPRASRSKDLHIRITPDELSLLTEGARKADMPVSDYARKRLWAAIVEQAEPAETERRLSAVVRERNELIARDAATLAEVQDFRRLFIDAMQLSLSGKLTVQHLRGLAERRSR